MSPKLKITSHDVTLGPSAQGLVFRALGLVDQTPSFLKAIPDLPCVLAGVKASVRSCLMCRGQVFSAALRSSVQSQNILCSSEVLCDLTKSSLQL